MVQSALLAFSGHIDTGTWTHWQQRGRLTLGLTKPHSKECRAEASWDSQSCCFTRLVGTRPTTLRNQGSQIRSRGMPPRARNSIASLGTCSPLVQNASPAS